MFHQITIAFSTMSQDEQETSLKKFGFLYNQPLDHKI